MELEKPTPLIFDYLPEPARLVRPVHGAITDGEVIGKVEAVLPVRGGEVRRLWTPVVRPGPYVQLPRDLGRGYG